MRRLLLPLLVLLALAGPAAPVSHARLPDHTQLARAGGGTSAFRGTRVRPTFRGGRRYRPGFGHGLFFFGGPGGGLGLLIVILVIVWLARRRRY